MEQVGFDLAPVSTPLDTGRSLAELEVVIEQGQQIFVEVGRALIEVRGRYLYRAEYATFEDYLERRWKMARRTGYAYIEAAEVATNVHTYAQNPPSRSQASLLAPLPVEEQREVASSLDFATATVAEVKEAVKERKEAKSHATAHAERLAAYEAKAVEREEVAQPDIIPFDQIVRGTDALAYLMGLPDGCADVCVTSPPYWAKRNYVPGDPSELGQETTPEEYVDRLCSVIHEIGRVLTPEGCLFLNVGDTLASQPGQYRGDPSRRRGISDQAIRANGTAPADRELDVAEKSYCLIPERVALCLVLQDGWRLSGKIVWHKLGHQPENVFDRLTQAWEPVYVLTRARHAYFKRGDERSDVWSIPVGRGGDAAGHLAPFPEALVERAIRHACPEGGVVLDPFAGSGTTLTVARRMGRRFLGCDLIAWGDA